MKKTNDVLEIHFQNFDAFKAEIRKSLLEKKKDVQPQSQVFFESQETYRKFMTMQKIELLSVIYTQSPESIYELALTVDRDFAAVFRDCTALANTGFIVLEDKNDSRGSKKPRLSFPYSCIVVRTPKVSYRIEFQKAA